MAQHPDVLIIGGGVIGLTTAYYLAREGAHVDVVDRSDCGREASWAGAGILPPGNPAQARTAFHQLRAQSAELYPALSAELRERTGVDNGYLRCGGLEFSAAADEMAVQEGHSEGIAFEMLAEPDLLHLEPALAPGLGQAYYFPDMAQIRNPRHLKALEADCVKRGVRIRTGCPVHGFERRGDRAVAARSASGSLPAGKFLLAAGAWTEQLLEQLGLRLGIHPVRGQIALLQGGACRIHRILMWGSRYLVPRPDGRILVGSTEELAGFEKQTTARAISELLSFAFRLVPALQTAAVEKCWAGFRPGSPDRLPFLGLVPGSENLYVAAGHFRAGLQLAPATGLVMKQLLLGQALSIPLEAFRLDRPSEAARPAIFPS